MELVVTEYLYGNYKEPEGILTNWRSSLVRTESIGAAASKYGFEPLLRLSRGERRGTERARAQILANSFEAVTGALYLDQGYVTAKDFIGKQLFHKTGSGRQTDLLRLFFADPVLRLASTAQRHR